MSETAAYKPHTATRVRMLGDAVPTFRPFRDEPDPKIVPKSSDELRADREAARDAAPMAASCGVDGCTWAYTGTAGDCRVESATHRADAHPELAGRRTHRQRHGFKQRGEVIDQAVVAESRRLRQERDDQQRLDTINRSRAARGEQPLEGATSMAPICKIDGCDEDASDAPKAGPTAKLCAAHRSARSAEISARMTGKPRGGRGVAPAPAPRVTKTVIGVPLAPQPEPVVVPSNGDGGTLAELARELEDARADVNRANSRWLDAIRAFKAHDVIQQIGEDVAA